MGCNFTEPYDHSFPVYHMVGRGHLQTWPDECVWAQLQSERGLRDQMGNNYGEVVHLANLEAEWGRRGLCSRCRREIGPSLDEQMSELEARVRNAEDKLGRIRQTVATRPDLVLRPEVTKILDEP